jgi:DNA-binding transcriptional MerR regulator
VLTIGGLAKKVGWSVPHIRELEAAGVLPPAGRTDTGGQRLYSDEQVAHIIEIKEERARRRARKQRHCDE